MSRRWLFPLESLTTEEQKLIGIAKRMYKKAICPHSHFPVGAALLAENNKGRQRIFTGCNIENSSYGCTICAERVAAVKAASEGFVKFIALALYAPAAPKRANSCGCGLCRQFLSDFGLQLTILKLRNDGKVVVKKLKQLLPNTFTPAIVKANST